MSFYFTDHKILIPLLLLMWLCGGWWQDHLIFIAELPSCLASFAMPVSRGNFNWVLAEMQILMACCLLCPNRIEERNTNKQKQGKLCVPKKRNSWQCCSCHKLLCSIFWVWHLTTETRVRIQHMSAAGGIQRTQRRGATALPAAVLCKTMTLSLIRRFLQGVRERARVPQLVMLCRRWAHLQCFAGRTGRIHGTTAGYCVARKRAQYRKI